METTDMETSVSAAPTAPMHPLILFKYILDQKCSCLLVAISLQAYSNVQAPDSQNT